MTEPEAQLYSVTPKRTGHRAGCVFGSGFYRIVVEGAPPRYCQSEAEVRYCMSLLGSSVRHVQRDGYCLDEDEYPEQRNDALTPDVVDAEQWLAMPQPEAMETLGLSTEREYARVYRMVENAVYARSNREAQGRGVRVPIVIKKKGRQSPVDVLSVTPGG